MIKVISDLDVFIPKHLTAIETQLLPLFQYLEFPEKIEFDDEILIIITKFL